MNFSERHWRTAYRDPKGKARVAWDYIASDVDARRVALTAEGCTEITSEEPHVPEKADNEPDHQ